MLQRRRQSARLCIYRLRELSVKKRRPERCKNCRQGRIAIPVAIRSISVKALSLGENGLNSLVFFYTIREFVVVDELDRASTSDAEELEATPVVRVGNAPKQVPRRG